MLWSFSLLCATSKEKKFQMMIRRPPSRKAVRMGVKVGKRKTKWYVTICHNRQRKAKSFNSEKAARIFAEKVDARLKLGELRLADAYQEQKQMKTFGEYKHRFLRMHA